MDWLYRAFQGGLKLMVMQAVSNQVFCNLANQRPGFGCDDMPAVDRQIAAAKAKEQYIDSISGGPGTGWYRIAYSPAQARQIIASGKLAVVLGIEVDGLLGCKENAGCTPADVDARLAQYYNMGVRHW